MITGEDEQSALDVLKNVYEETEKLRAQDGDEFIFLNRMRSPIKRIQEKFRFQVLMRLKSGKYLKTIYDMAASYSDSKTFVYVEENPANLS